MHPRELVEAGEELRAAIEARLEIKRKTSPEYLVNILIGRATDEVKSYGHEKLESFGVLSDKDDKFVTSLVRQASVEGFFEKDIENYAFIEVSKKGKEFLKSKESFKMALDREFADVDVEFTPKAGSGAADPELFSMLKDLRKDLSRKLNLPPYVLFQETSLECMATTYPVTMSELSSIPGVGEGKAKRYGGEFLMLIQRHVEENDIERPVDMKVRSLANRSKQKVMLIQCVDKKIDLEELARSKGLEFEELLDELESIVEAGTKINIDYYIEDVMDTDHMLDILDVLKECEEDDIDEVLDELGEDYTEEEVRLVRIKFLSELGI